MTIHGLNDSTSTDECMMELRSFPKGPPHFQGKKNVINLEYLFKNKKFQVCSCFVDMLEFLLSDYLM